MILRIYKFIGALIVSLIFFSCSNTKNKSNVKGTENDTLKIMKLLIDSAFYLHNLPDISALTRDNPFGDTIIFRKEIFQSDIDIVRFFPQDRVFKFLSQSEICSLAINSLNDSIYFPNFLEIRRFKKVDTIYEVYLQNTCVIPHFDKNGKHLFKKGKLEGSDSLPCIFGMLCGGGIGMTFTKQGESFQSKITGRWSD